MDDSTMHVLISAGSIIFTSGGFYIYVRMSLKNLEERQIEARTELHAKVDKNYETLDAKIDKNQLTLLADVSGVGARLGRNERDAQRRYHNTSLALMLAVPPKDETKITHLLKEEN